MGVLGCVAGWKGPGKQCSLAFLHDRNDANRGTIKGILPLQLRGTLREIIFGIFQNYLMLAGVVLTLAWGHHHKLSDVMWHMFSVGIRRHKACEIQFFVCVFSYI